MNNRHTHTTLRSFSRHLRYRQVVGAWLMLLSLLPLVSVKSAHHHSVLTSDSAADSQQTWQQDRTCPICWFTLSTFVEPQTTHVCTPLPMVIRQAVSRSTSTEERNVCFLSLRAPPMI
ncbi:MAG: hypothetical protein IJ680_07475 [Paludibacteraceae bacterium]|nr:hypothetical protein [Paludibacteraceae bacterium]